MNAFANEKDIAMPPSIVNPLRAVRFAAAAVAAFAVSACALSDAITRDFQYMDFALATLPSYQAGDTFTYVDAGGKNYVRKVVKTDEDIVEWITETNYRFSAYRNFALPKISWDGPSSSGKMLSSLDPGQLWPLERKNKAEITVTYHKHDKIKKLTEKYQENWSCQVNRDRIVTVPAGTFKTFKIVCKRLDEAQKVTRTHIWFYAPEVGHFVKRIKKYGSKRRQVIELISYSKANAAD